MTHPSLRIEQWPLAKLLRYANNSRDHSETQITQISASIAEFGFVNPCLIDAKGVLIAGHGRVAGAQKLGLETVPVIRLGHLTDTQARALRIADNAIALNSTWNLPALKIELEALKLADYPMELVGFDNIQLVEFMSGVPTGKDPEATPEPPATPVSKRGDIWLLGQHRLMCGDATSADDVERLLDGHRADCVFTSPPYGVGIDYGESYADNIANLRDMLPKLARIWSESVVDGGFAVINFGDIVSGREAAAVEEPCEYPMALEYWPAFRNAEWVLWSRRIWQKPNARVNSPWVMQSCRAASDWEHIWTWKASGTAIMPRGEHSAFGVWDSLTGAGVDIGKNVHGAGMAASIAIRAVETHARVAHYVLEPFCGTGTTLVACELKQRKCLAMEIEPASCDLSLLRWQDLVEKEAVHAETGATYDETKSERIKPKRRKRAA